MFWLQKRPASWVGMVNNAGVRLVMKQSVSQPHKGKTILKILSSVASFLELFV